MQGFYPPAGGTRHETAIRLHSTCRLTSQETTMDAQRLTRFTLIVAATALLFSNPAAAAPYRIDFTGVISNSTDQGSVLFGNGASGGQNGLTVTGRFDFDSTAYADQNPSPYFGTYGPTNGLFPQPLNLITSNITIAGQTFYGSTYMGPSNQHSIEFASVQNIPPVNHVQQDIYWISDGSQKLVCANSNPASCSGGAQGTSQITLKLFGIYDFLGSDGLAQPLDLNAAQIGSILGSPGGGQSNSYFFQESNATYTQWLFNAGGEFNLTSLRISEVPAVTPVPEPEIYAMMGLGLGLLGWAGRRRKSSAA